MMKKTDSSEVTNVIALSLCMGIPVIACAVISLNLFLESGDWFVSGMLFLFLSLICAMIVEALTPAIFVFSLFLDGLWWLVKLTFRGIRQLINRSANKPA